MVGDDEIADALDSLAFAVVGACRELQPPPTGRVVLKSRRHESWFVVFYFGSRDELVHAVKYGAAYSVLQVFRANEGRVPSSPSVIVYFEGEFPKQEGNWARVVLDWCVNRTERAHGWENAGVCVWCGHDPSKHNLCRWCDDDEAAPTEGWMCCGDERCECFGTWSLGAPANKEA